jgi:hypothetical protein
MVLAGFPYIFRTASGAHAAKDDLGLVDVSPIGVVGLEAGLLADGAGDVADLAAMPAHGVVVPGRADFEQSATGAGVGQEHHSGGLQRVEGVVDARAREPGTGRHDAFVHVVGRPVPPEVGQRSIHGEARTGGP